MANRASQIRNKWLLDVSSGFDDIGKWCADQVNDGDEGRGLSIAPCSSASGFEDAVHSFEAGVGVGRLPSPENAIGM